MISIKTLAISMVVIAIVIFTAIMVKEEFYRPAISDFESRDEDVVITVEDQEKANPVTYLKAEGNFRDNLIGQWIVEGNISSEATIVNYKDAVIMVSFYSKTETLLGKEHFIVYDYFRPGSSKEFKIKTKGFKGTTIIGLEVTGATAI